MDPQFIKLTINPPKPKKANEKEPKAPRVPKKKRSVSVFRVENGNFLVRFD